MDGIFRNYEAFYNMVLSTTIMSNAPTPELEKDARSIISFIGKAYRLDDALIEKCKTVILDQLSGLGLTTDQQAVYSSRSYGDGFSAADVLFDIKGDVLTKLQSLSKIKDLEINPGWYDYSHYKTYQAQVRFAKIYTTAASGNLITTRQVGILQTLGIGCTMDVQEGIRRLTQCVLWGDIPSMYYLAYAYELEGNRPKADVCRELTELAEKYLKTGCTVLPKDASSYSEEARDYYTFISTIKQDIVYAYDRYDIDFSFVEAITSDSLDRFGRMDYINNYDRKQWKNVTNSSEKPTRKFGF